MGHQFSMQEDFYGSLQNYVSDAVSTFRSYKTLAEKALAQISDEEFFLSPDEESNSPAILVKHIAGNQRSRWRNFLTEDGEKPDRNRDSEFVEAGQTRDHVMEAWEQGWTLLFETLEGIGPEDLSRKVLIRTQQHTVIEAINRQLTHYAYHVGQVVYACKAIRKSDWNTLSVPRNRSAAFNEFMERRGGTADEGPQPLEGPAEFTAGEQPEGPGEPI